MTNRKYSEFERLIIVELFSEFFTILWLAEGLKMTKKALITGITGQDGTYLAQFLLKKNCKN